MPKNLEVTSTFTLFSDQTDLPATYRELIDVAMDTAMQAYAPYSNFKVGAAVLTEDNKIVRGSNQENAAYPTGLCAERVAIFSASSIYPDVKIKAIAIVANKNNEWKASMPCGACRQAIREYETKQENSIKIIMAYKEGKYILSDGAEDLLPLSFTKTDL